MRKRHRKYKRDLRKEINEKNGNNLGALTTDIWTSGTNDAFLGCTYHYITKNWKLKSKTLTVRHIPKERHKAAVIAQMLAEVRT